MTKDAKTRTRDAWLERTNDLPRGPGVYLMKGREGEVIYVGKAKNLKSRVRSYFREGTSDYRAFIGLLGRLLTDIETVVTSSEKEALLLERELIRRHEPRFNVIWRDDKQYLMLRIDTGHEWPWVQVVRNAKKDGAHYFGPFHSASAARQTLRVVNRHFQLRTCRDSVLYHRKRPCIEYQIGRCPAPCCLSVPQDEYRQSVDDVLMFLEGRKEELVDRIETRMWSAAERTDYEVAAHYRDQLRAVEKTLERQHVASSKQFDLDAFGLFREDPDLCVAVVEVRGGRVTNVSHHWFEAVSGGDEDSLESFLLQRYDAEVAVPPEILVPLELASRPALEEILGERRGQQTRIAQPRRGEKARLLELARDNAEHGFQEQRLKSGAVQRTLQALASSLRLSRLPLRIECYDISNLGPHSIVGSQVVFERAMPAKARYRRYHVKTTAGQDDFASMYEVLSRRFRRGLAERDLPDLVVIDGGKGQLNVARAVFEDLGIEDVDLVSLAKSRITEAGDDPGRSPERVFVPGLRDPIVLGPRSPELLLLARIRDEAHRFAITFHRELQRKARTRSSLEDVPGIGPGRRRALLKHFGSLRRLRQANLEELAEVPGVGRSAARALHRALHPGDETNAPNQGPGSDDFGKVPAESVDSLNRDA